MTQSFIERQFPVSKVSKESYKERKAVQSQTLTGMGRWWGRKPLMLVRAAILACLLPATDNPEKDKEVFLKILSMDEKGLLARKEKKFSISELQTIISSNRRLKDKYSNCFEVTNGKVKIRNGSPRAEMERDAFASLSYDQKITMCLRPEQIEMEDADTWADINYYLGTTAHNLSSLVNQLSMKRYGHNVVVGDCFCGGGSIPFEAARMGCDTYASDLNPIAGLLTWASIHLCGLSDEDYQTVLRFRNDVFARIEKYISDLGIEKNESDDQALGYIYCQETVCPECGVRIPLLSSFVIGKRAGRVIAKLIREGDHFDIQVCSDVSEEEFTEAGRLSTVDGGSVICPNCHLTTPLSSLRGDRMGENGTTIYGLRMMDQNEFEPAENDVFQDRLYAIRYLRKDGSRYYTSPSKKDKRNEEIIRDIIKENFADWQKNGWIPSMSIENGDKTIELIRNRGWSYWHQLYTPRQLLYLSLLSKYISEEEDKNSIVSGILGLNKCADFASKLCGWTASVDISTNTFYNQALNPLTNWGERSFYMYKALWDWTINRYKTSSTTSVELNDARNVDRTCDLWITDPPYADAVCYHELSEYFLSWDKPLIMKAFPDWYTDSKRILAVRGDEHFSQTMIDIYSNLTRHMNDDGMQIVMFTHSDPAVWAQLALIMWKAGLTVTAAWNIATETDASGLKEGNYVKGTVLLVLRKQQGDDEAFLDELAADIKNEVRNQIQSMQKLDDKEDPNFSDPDYVLAAYAASLKVLTGYKAIGEIDLDYELDLAIHDPSKSQVVKLIERAKKIAYDFIIPLDFDNYLWRDLSPSERFYIKGLEAEKHGNYQVSTYQEYARGFGLSSYGQLMANEKANSARLKTPQEFAMRTVSDIPDFEASLLRMVLAAIHIGIKEDENPDKGFWYIKNNVDDYWNKRDMLKQLLEFLKDTENIDTMPHWHDAAVMASHIYTLINNDHI